MVGDVAIAGRNSQFEIRYDLPERVIPAAAPRGAHADRARRRQGARPPGGPLARRRHPPRPGRLLPPALRARPEPDRSGAGGGRARRGRRADPGDGRGRPATGLPPSRRAAPATGRRPRTAQPVRPGRLGAGAYRDALRLPLPDRDLHAGREAHPWLLRPAVPARRPDRRTRRPQGRPQGGAAAGRRRPTPSRVLPTRPPRSSPRSWSGWPAGSVSPRSSSSHGATWLPRWRRQWPPADVRAGPRATGNRPGSGRWVELAEFIRRPHREPTRACHSRQAPPHRRGQDPAPAGGGLPRGQRHRGRLRGHDRRRAARADRRVQGAAGRRASRSTT